MAAKETPSEDERWMFRGEDDRKKSRGKAPPGERDAAPTRVNESGRGREAVADGATMRGYETRPKRGERCARRDDEHHSCTLSADTLQTATDPPSRTFR